ncbi:MAG: hypothetical protein SFU56_04140 [Capsulimonadales bacterium]|nr:hypothetical protein [Capsulimonadales bacterium]
MSGTRTNNTPACPHCKSGNAVRNGGTPNNPQFRCRACGRYYYAHRRPDLTERPCPQCNGPCIKRGFAKNGAQKYKCKTCGKMNTDLYPSPSPPLALPGGAHARSRSCHVPSPPPAGAGGPSQLLTLYLDVHSHWHLDRYCHATGRNYLQAIRHLLREVGTAKFSGLTHSSLPRLRHERRVRGPGGQEPGARITFPDARPQSRKQRIGLPRRQAHKYITLKITILLDALCLQGIRRTRDYLARSGPSQTAAHPPVDPPTHQDAVRHILRNARLPDTPRPTTAPRHRPDLSGDGDRKSTKNQPTL